MSVQALTWSFDLQLNDMALKAALHALANFADEQGRCWPSIARVARCMGASESTARRAIRRLVDLGVVEADHTTGGAGKTNRFTLNFGWENPVTTTGLNPVTTEPLQDGTLAACTENPVSVHQNPVNLHENPGALTPEPSRTVKNHHLTKEEESKLPEDWLPDAELAAYAADKGLDTGATVESFVDYFTAGKGKREKRTAKAWRRRFRLWCNREAEYRRLSGGKSVSGETFDQRRIREAREAAR